MQLKNFMFIPLIIVISIGNAGAIIIRHDVDDQQYLDLGDKYSPSVAYINGCAGTLLDDNWVLTAAHCVYRRENRLLFARHLDQEYRVEKVVVHPEHGLDQGVRHDVALIQLKKEVNGGRPAKLYDLTDEKGKSVVFVGKGGFGNGRDGSIAYDRKQRGATNTIIRTDEHWIEFVFDSPGDATELEGISGAGDSGGPAFIINDAQLYVAGVSSYQDSDGHKKATYGVLEYYARVSTYAEWIRSTMHNADVVTAIPNHPIIDAIKSEDPKMLSSALSDDVLNDEKVISEAFFQSVILNRVSMGEELIVQGSDLGSLDIYGNTLFELTILTQRQDYLKMLILKFGDLENIHRKNSEIVPMLVAVFGKGPEVLELINIVLDQGANINVQTPQRDTAIMLAARLTDNLDLVALLTNRGADVNIPNEDGDTPIIGAAFEGKNDILEYLLNNGADKDVKNNVGLSALDMAREAENSDAIKILVSKSGSRK